MVSVGKVVYFIGFIHHGQALLLRKKIQVMGVVFLISPAALNFGANMATGESGLRENS